MKQILFYLIIGAAAWFAFDRAELPRLTIPTGPAPVQLAGQGETAVYQTPQETAVYQPPAQPAARPVRIVSPDMGLNAAIQQSRLQTGDDMTPAYVPAVDAAWDVNSAAPGEGGNVILFGHNYSAFSPLQRAALGQLVDVHTETGAVWRYRLVDLATVQEAGVSFDQRVANGRYLGQTDQERLTLVTCLPFPAGDTHRLILIGELVEKMGLGHRGSQLGRAS